MPITDGFMITFVFCELMRGISWLSSDLMAVVSRGKIQEGRVSTALPSSSAMLSVDLIVSMVVSLAL